MKDGTFPSTGHGPCGPLPEIRDNACGVNRRKHLAVMKEAQELLNRSASPFSCVQDLGTGKLKKLVRYLSTGIVCLLLVACYLEAAVV